jgi:hypothetical protein
MKRIRFIGLSLVAVFAMSAVAAASASAFEKFEAQTYPVTIEATNEHGAEKSINKFKVNSGESKCEHSNFKSGSYTGPQTEVEVTPSYTSCQFTPVGLPLETAEVKMEGCKYILSFTIPPTNEGNVKIVCTGTNTIVVKAASCTVHVGPQTLAKQVTYANVGSGSTEEVEVKSGSAEQIAYTELAGCPESKLTETNRTNGKYEGTNWSKGFNSLKAQEGVFVK